MFEIPDYVGELLKKIAKSEGFTNYSTELKAGSNHGDNFTSNLASASFRGTRIVNGVPKKDELHLLCKFGSSNAQRRKEFHTADLFEREIDVYKRVLPIFAKFQQERGLSDDESFAAYPKVFTGISDEVKEQFVIVMEDLRPKGYTMWPKNQPVPLDHVMLMLKQLGKYHGISFAMKDQRPDLFEGLKGLQSLMVNFFRNPNSLKMMHASYDRAIDSLKNEHHIQILKDVKNNTIEYLEDCLKHDDCGKFAVIGHGDCWSNNLLYLYKHEVNKHIFFCV